MLVLWQKGFKNHTLHVIAFSVNADTNLSECWHLYFSFDLLVSAYLYNRNQIMLFYLLHMMGCEYCIHCVMCAFMQSFQTIIHYPIYQSCCKTRMHFHKQETIYTSHLSQQISGVSIVATILNSTFNLICSIMFHRIN